jgi:hypothetical protein
LIARSFVDESGEIWIVRKIGSNLEVVGPRNNERRLHEIARSCARKLGVSHTQSGVPLQYINQHRRIWNVIWNQGKQV